MQFGQELLLLRQAIASAVEKQHYDFSAQDGDNMLRCAKLVKETANDVKEMMEIDDQGPHEIEEAQRSMHFLLFYKTLQTEGDLEDPKECYESVCLLFPAVSWPVYVQTSVICGWNSFVLECLAALGEDVLAKVLQLVIKSLFPLQCKNAVCLWHCLLLKALEVVLDGGGSDAMLPVVKQCLKLDCSVDLLNVRAKAVVESLAWFCMSVHTRTCHPQITCTIGDVLNVLLEAAKDVIPFASCCELKASVGSCYFTVKDLCCAAEVAELKVAPSLNSWLETVRELNAMKDVGEDRVLMDIQLLNAGTHFPYDAINRFISTLEANVDERIVQCLLENCSKLDQRSVFRLLQIAPLTSVESDPSVQEICVKAFSSWSIRTQDVFREEYHTRYDLEEHAMQSHLFANDLTKVFNRLSSGDGIELSAVGDMSLMCLRFPIETIEGILDYAIKNGQISVATKILAHLKSTCNARVTSFKMSLVNYHVRNYITEKEDIQASHWSNFTELLKELLKENICCHADLLEKALMRHLTPSPFCYRVLQVLQVFLQCSSDEQIKSAFGSASVTILLFLVSQILDNCMSQYTNVPYAPIAWDAMELKEEAVSALCVVKELLQKHRFLSNDLDLCWFRVKTANFHVVVHSYLKEILYGTCSQNGMHETWFEWLTLDELLFVACISSDLHEAVLNFMLSSQKCLFQSGFREAVVVVFVKILARLVSRELRVIVKLLTRFLSLSHANHSSGSEISPVSADEVNTEDMFKIITYVIDSHLVLFPCNTAILTTSLMLRIVQNFTTAIKEILDEWERLPGDFAVDIICIVVRMATALPDQCQTALKLLILNTAQKMVNAVRESHPRSTAEHAAVMTAVKMLQDDTYLVRVQQVLKPAAVMSHQQ